MAPRACPACDARAIDVAYRVNGYQLVRCSRCRSLFVDPPPTEEQLSAVYGAEAYYDNARNQEERVRREFRARARQLSATGARSVLDIGCAAGFFLDAAQEEGLEAVGVEPGPAGDDALARGHQVQRAWLADADLGGRTFDAVSLWEVIEHVSDPRALLQQALRYLKPTGIVALSTPSMSGAPALVLGRRFPMICPPEHLTLFTRNGLERLLRSAGLEVKAISSFSNLGPEQIVSGLQRFVFGRSDLARLLASALAPAAVAAARVMDRSGLGSEYQVLAVRDRR